MTEMKACLATVLLLCAARWAHAATPLDHSEIVASDFPMYMAGGNSYPVSLSVKNLGSNPWSAADGYGLILSGECIDCTTEDIAKAGSPITFEGFALTGIVEPGVTFTFGGTVTAPSFDYLYCHCQSTLRMSRNGVPFGAAFVWTASNGWTTPSPTPVFSPSPTPTISPTFTPSATPMLSATPSPTPSPQPPVFIIQPESITANPGQNVDLVALAWGEEPIAYQWFLGDEPIPLTGSGTLHLGLVGAESAGVYRCEAANNGGTAASNLAELSVNAPALPNGAEFLSSTLPPMLAPGQVLFIGVTMRNTGGASWSASQGYSLATQFDPAGMLGLDTRFVLPDHAPVVNPAGGLAQFVLRIQAPDSPGVRAAKLRMVEEAVEFFGDEVTLTVAVAEPLNAAFDWEKYE